MDATPPAGPETNASPRPAGDERSQSRIYEPLLAALVVSLLVLVKTGLEVSYYGSIIAQAGNALLQHALIEESDQDLPITLIDIGGISLSNSPPESALPQVTSRDSLKKLLVAILSLERGPLAIGIDIDFSGAGGKSLTPNDKDFINFCYQMSKANPNGIPILLGVYRQAANRNDDWLKNEKLRSLAVTISSASNYARLPIFEKASQSDLKPIPSLSAALGQYLLDFNTPKEDWIERFLVSEEKHTLSGRLADAILWRELPFKAQTGEELVTYLVDFGPLPGLRKQTQNFAPVRAGKESSWVEAAREKISGHVVLIGDARVGLVGDQFSLPLIDPKAVPGLLIQASGALTWRNGLLFEFTPASRVLLDIIVAAATILLGSLVCGMLQRRWPVYPNRIEWAVYIVLSLLVWKSAFLLIRHARVMWPDFILVGLALLLHPPCRAILDNVLNYLAQTLIATFFVPQRDSKTLYAVKLRSVATLICGISIVAIGFFIYVGQRRPEIASETVPLGRLALIDPAEWRKETFGQRPNEFDLLADATGIGSNILNPETSLASSLASLSAWGPSELTVPLSVANERPVATAAATALPEPLQEARELRATGGRLLSEHNYESALAALGSAIRLDPKNPEGYEGRGDVYAGEGNYDKAIASYRKALRLDPQDTDTFADLGSAYEHKSAYRRAIEYYDRAIKLGGPSGRLSPGEVPLPSSRPPRAAGRRAFLLQLRSGAELR